MNTTWSSLNDFENYVESVIIELKSLGNNQPFQIQNYNRNGCPWWFLMIEGNELIKIRSSGKKNQNNLRSLFSRKKRSSFLSWCYFRLDEFEQIKSGEYRLTSDSIEFLLNPEVPYLSADIIFSSEDIIVLRRNSAKIKSQMNPSQLFHIEPETGSLLFLVNEYSKPLHLRDNRLKNDYFTTVKTRRILIHKILNDLKSSSIRIHRFFNWDMTYTDIIIDKGRPIEKPFPLGLSFEESKTRKALNGYYDLDNFRYSVRGGVIIKRFHINKFLSNRNKVVFVFSQEKGFFKNGDFMEINRTIPKDDLYIVNNTQFETKSGTITSIKYLSSLPLW